MNTNQLTDESIRVLQSMADEFGNLALNTGRQAPVALNKAASGFARGYLLQGVSRGEYAACELVVNSPQYRNWKLDIAGILYLGYSNGTSKFSLRFSRRNIRSGLMETWFDTNALTVDNLTVQVLLDEIVRASSGQLSKDHMLSALGHPVEATQIVANRELYPALPSDYSEGDLIRSKTGSWIFSIHRSKLPDDADFDIDLLFSADPDAPVQLNGPCVMTLTEISDSPTGDVIVVKDIFDVASPTPLRAGCKVALAPFDDIGYGIFAAWPREYFFEKQYST